MKPKYMGKLILWVNCTCPACGTHHKAKNCDYRKFCPTCKRIADDDYSGGAGVDPKTKFYSPGRKTA
jgi:tRNA(Ile2) C34 agmatinyltransferase TiaS